MAVRLGNWPTSVDRQKLPARTSASVAGDSASGRPKRQQRERASRHVCGRAHERQATKMYRHPFRLGPAIRVSNREDDRRGFACICQMGGLAAFGKPPHRSAHVSMESSCCLTLVGSRTSSHLLRVSLSAQVDFTAVAGSSTECCASGFCLRAAPSDISSVKRSRAVAIFHRNAAR